MSYADQIRVEPNAYNMRELIADGIEENKSIADNANAKSDNAVSVSNQANNRVDNIIQQQAKDATTPVEIVESRQDSVNNITYKTLEERLNSDAKKFNDLQISVRNLLTGTKDWKEWINSGAAQIDTSMQYNGCIATKAISAWNYYYQTYNFSEVGKTYTLGAWVYTTATNIDVGFYGWSGEGEGHKIIDANKWTRWYFTFTVDGTSRVAQSNVLVRIETGNATQDNPLWVCGMTLVEGNKDVGWIPAPEDIYSIEIGVNNVLKNTAFKTLAYWGTKGIAGCATLSTSYKYNLNNSVCIDLEGYTTNCYGGIGQTITNQVIPGETYIISFYAMCPDLSKFTSDLRVYFPQYDASGNLLDDWAQVGDITASQLTQGVWKKFSYKITFNPSFKTADLNVDFSSNGLIYLNSFKLEKGDKSTDWTVSIDDISTPPGKVEMFLTGSIPAGYLEMNGQWVSKDIFSDLYAVISPKIEDQSHPNMFQIPDIENRFPRAAGNELSVGTKEEDNVPQYKYTQTIKFRSAGYSNGTGLAYTDGGSVANDVLWTGTGEKIDNSEVRPKDMAFLFGIKY